MDKEQEGILDSFKITTKAILEIIDGLEEDQLIRPKSVDIWSPVEILEHLYRSEVGYITLFTGPSKLVAGRTPTAKIDQFKSAFSTNDNQYKAPKITQPQKELSTPIVIDKYHANRKLITTIISNNREKMEYVMQKFSHPSFGYLTGIEWIAFSNIHTQRHIKQIKQRVRSMQ